MFYIYHQARRHIRRFNILRSIIHIIVLSILVLLLQPACNKSTEVLPPALADLCQIHLQNWFSDTPVKVVVDNSQVFSDTITTGSILAFAAIIPVQVSQGTHGLIVTVADSVSNDTAFTITDTLYIGVNYNEITSTIRFVFRDRPFYYR
jgi:hypothetical protein